MMFREVTRVKQQLPPAECVEILKSELRGVLSVVGDEGYPYGMPMNHWYNAEDGCIYFHCGRSGHRLDALKRCSKASYCVCDRGVREEEQWAWKVKSVVVFGQVRVIDDMDMVTDITTKLSLKFTQDLQYIKEEVERSGRNTLLLRLEPEHICGKRVTEA